MTPRPMEEDSLLAFGRAVLVVGSLLGCTLVAVVGGLLAVAALLAGAYLACALYSAQAVVAAAAFLYLVRQQLSE